MMKNDYWGLDPSTSLMWAFSDPMFSSPEEISVSSCPAPHAKVLRRHIEQGLSLHEHHLREIFSCPHCRRRLRGHNRTQAMLQQLQSQAVPQHLLPVAAGRGLAMLHRAERMSANAKELLRSRANLSVWSRIRWRITQGLAQVVVTLFRPRGREED